MSAHPSPTFSTDQLPRLEDKTIVVTGANSGIGLEASRMFAAAGARVFLACRDATKAADAIDRIRRSTPDARLAFRPLDLANLASVREFAAAFAEESPRLDVLVNNAGVMALPRRTTADGFEMQFGTNHLGHFALTALLFDRIVAAGSSRIVNVSSGAHRFGWMRFDDLHGERRYSKWLAYGQSKLANLLFTFELARRIDAKRLPVRAVACHPGYADTNLQYVGPQMERNAWGVRQAKWVAAHFSQTAEQGALPTVYAAVMPDVASGDYVGPDGWMEFRGQPRKVDASVRARDVATASRLWDVSEELTGVRFDALSA